MKIERTLDRVTLLPDELIALITEHIEQKTGRKVDGQAFITSQAVGNNTQYIASARLKDEK